LDTVEYVTRDEFNGLGARVSELRENCIGCKTAVQSDIRYLNQEQKELKVDMSELKSSITKLSEQVQALTIKLSIAIAIIVTVVNFVVPYLLKKFGG
jgi:hypothetical protein